MALKCSALSGKISKCGISESPGKLWKVSVNAVWPRSPCTLEYFVSAHSHLCCPSLLLSSLFFFFLHDCHTSDISSSSIYEASNVKRRGWNGRVWNMKRSYVRKLSWVKRLCTRKHTLSHIRILFSLKRIVCILEGWQTCWIHFLLHKTFAKPIFFLIILF